MLCAPTALHAGMVQANDTIQLSPLADKMLEQALPASLNKVVRSTKSIVLSATANTTLVDSIVNYDDGEIAGKTYYTHYDNGDIKTTTEYDWDAALQKFRPTSRVYKGEGGETPAYIIKSKFDADGNELPQSRTEYNWASYKALDPNLDICQWKHGALEQRYENGQWQTVSSCTPDIQDSLLMGLTFFELNDNGQLAEANKVTYQYDAEKRLTGIVSTSNQEDEPLRLKITYNTDGNVTWYGYEDESWYRCVTYGANGTREEMHEKDNGIDQITYTEVNSIMQGTPFDFVDNQQWQVSTEGYYDNGILEYSEVSMTSAAGSHVYVVYYNLDADNNKSDIEAADIDYTDDNIAVTYYDIEENYTKTKVCSYSMVSSYIDDYTKSETVYDEDGMTSSQDVMYYRNPSTGINLVKTDTAKRDNRVYDLLGRMTTSKKGLRIVNGKKVLMK